MKCMPGAGFSGFQYAGTVRAIVRLSPVRPVLRRGPMNGFKKILFPTDFSANADKALAHAIRLAEFDKGEVIVQHVVGDYFERHSQDRKSTRLNSSHTV